MVSRSTDIECGLGEASGAAETRDGGACKTDQTKTRTRTTASHITPLITRKTTGHG